MPTIVSLHTHTRSPTLGGASSSSPTPYVHRKLFSTIPACRALQRLHMHRCLTPTPLRAHVPNNIHVLLMLLTSHVHVPQKTLPALLPTPYNAASIDAFTSTHTFN
ncbi:hypothetical protein Pmani_001055 [Petrolisthes manimaculis]|uniref:Uncharacterized protein n=1 Tax=Petrolisthes manimaculis TaxID=1843537 RepID=A0AAE1USF1_9EUCA|nr:hypothetical protein Pmani_001055 [Petrolisthes manimaculis]